MPEATPDVLIIGGGIIGVASAYYLAQTGASITLIEQGEIAAGCSHGNAGLLCPCHSTPIPGPGVLTQGMKWLFDAESPFYVRPRLDRQLLRWLWHFQSACNPVDFHRAIPLLRDIQRDSLSRYQALIADEQIACHFQPSGGLTAYKTQRAWRTAAQDLGIAQRYGLDTVLLRRDALRELEPAIHEDVIGALHHREDAHLDPALFMKGMGQAIVRHGVSVHTHTTVTNLDTRRTASGNNVTHVHTTRGSFQPRQVVLAAGAHSNQILEQLGVSILLQPAKGYSITAHRPTLSPRHHIHMAEAKAVVTPIGPYLRFAGTLELTGIDHSINRRRVNAIRRNARGYLRQDPEREPVEIWGGMRPCSPDGLPYIGRTRTVSNLVVATGHAMLGMSMGPATGALVTAIVSEEPTFVDLSLLDPERFS